MEQPDDLARELAALREEVARLRAQVEPADQRLSRRHLLRAAPVVAVGGAIAALAGASPAAAAVGDPVLQGQSNDTGSATTSLSGGSGTAPALDVTGGIHADRTAWGMATLPSGDGLLSVAPEVAVFGTPGIGDPAVTIVGGPVVGGYHNIGRPALHVEATGPGAAVEINVKEGSAAPDGPYGLAYDVYSTGVRVTAAKSTAVDVTLTDPTTTNDAITIDYAGTSRALHARSRNAANTNGTVTGVNEGEGIGVWGEQRNDTLNGYGVVGVAGRLGRGGQFSGGRAAVRMVPSTAASHPSTGRVGDFFVDASARIWFCVTASTSTAAAHWRQLAFV